MGPRHSKPAILVVNYHSDRLLQDNLSPLTEELTEATVIVWDNSTSPAYRLACQQLCNQRGWLYSGGAANVGFGVGMNRAGEQAIQRGSTVLMLLNPDAAIAAQDARMLLDAAAENPRTMFSPKLVDQDRKIRPAGRYVDLRTGRMTKPQFGGELAPHPGYLPYLGGACLALTADLWAEIGGFSEDYFLYWEDVELAHRVVQAGGTLRIHDAAAFTHAQGGTQRAQSTEPSARKSTDYVYYNVRNRLIFATRNLPPNAQRAWRRSDLSATAQILRRGGRRQALLSPSHWHAALRGIRDGRAAMKAGGHYR